MISKDLLQLLTLTTLIVLCIVAIVLIIYGIVKKKNTVFAVSQIIYAGAVLCVMTIGFYGGVTCEYIGGTEHTNIKAIETETMTYSDNRTYTEYVATTEDDKKLKTKNLVYGNELKYLDNCKVVKTTAFGFKVYSNESLLVCTPSDENFDTMSESSKESLLRKLNNGVEVIGK